MTVVVWKLFKRLEKKYNVIFCNLMGPSYLGIILLSCVGPGAKERKTQNISRTEFWKKNSLPPLTRPIAVRSLFKIC
jgi:hypothetical protein